MEILGNLFTHYNYTTTDITRLINSDTIEINSTKSAIHVLVETESKDKVELPIDSPFQDWKEARRYAGPLPFTFSYNSKTNNILIIEGVREHWKPEPSSGN